MARIGVDQLAHMDDEPVKTAPAVFATAMAKLAPSAKKMDLSESAPADASRSDLEQVLDPVRPALGVGRVPVAALAERFVELLQQLALVLGELDRRLDA